VVLAGALAACSRENPWFLVDGGGGATGDAGPSSTGDADGGPGGTSSSGEDPPEESSGVGPVDSGEEPGESTSSSTTSGEASTGEPMTTDAETSTGEQPEEVVLVDLWALCPKPTGMWAGGSMGQDPVECDQVKPQGLWVKRHASLEYEGEQLPLVIELSPSKVEGGSVTGRYPEIKLPADLAPQARLVAEVICPASEEPNPPCEVQADLYAEVDEAPVAFATVNVADGQRKLLIAELGDDPTIAAGEPFTVILSVSVGAEVTPADRAYVVAPRIVAP
jgi:hypothetical protein